MNIPPSPDRAELDEMRWLDGEMSAAESAAFAEHLAQNPEAQSRLDSMRALSPLLKKQFPGELPVPHADFFNSQLLARINRMDNEPAATARRLPSWVQLPILRWTLAACALVLVVNGLGWLQKDVGLPYQSSILRAYTPDPTLNARWFAAEESGASVLVIEGLPDLPRDRTIVGLQPSVDASRLMTRRDPLDQPLQTLPREARPESDNPAPAVVTSP